MPYKLGLFDWNQTLLNDSVLSYICLGHVFHTFAPDKQIPSLETVRRESNNSDWGTFFHRHGIPASVTMVEMLDCWFEHYRLPAHKLMLDLNDGAIKLLEFCQTRGIPSAIVTASKDSIYSYLEWFAIRDLFVAVEHNTLNGWTKEIAFRKLIDQFGVKPWQTFCFRHTHMAD